MEKHEILVNAISHYIDLICMGDVEGTDEECEILQDFIEQINTQKENKTITLKNY